MDHLIPTGSKFHSKTFCYESPAIADHPGVAFCQLGERQSHFQHEQNGSIQQCDLILAGAGPILSSGVQGLHCKRGERGTL
ncbi:hypothetical protein PC128_g14637 [Phytophthora cactorum]|nr:hypothetical protein PC128_g14637 [Phytophthora cactorum]